MKRNLLIVTMVLCSLSALGQENMFTLSGGYVFTNIEDVDQNATGFRINGLYEFNPNASMVAHGFSFDWLQTKASSSGADYTLSSIPFYYAPKLLLGQGSLKAFLKGALGGHYSNYKRTGSLGDIDTWDFGFYGGASLGAMKSFNDKVFINVEYEWAYLSNSAFRDGFVNSIMGGIGMRF